MLSDWQIRARIENGGNDSVVIDPYDPDLIQPASIDMRYSGRYQFMIPSPVNIGGIKPTAPKYGVVNRGLLVLPPGGFALASTLERVEIPNDLAGRLEGKSSLARSGLVIHTTAGFIDPGFRGYPTLELANVGNSCLYVFPEALICQMAFERLDRPAERPYGHPDRSSKYQDQSADPTGAIFR